MRLLSLRQLLLQPSLLLLRRRNLLGLGLVLLEDSNVLIREELHCLLQSRAIKNHHEQSSVRSCTASCNQEPSRAITSNHP